MAKKTNYLIGKAEELTQITPPPKIDPQSRELYTINEVCSGQLIPDSILRFSSAATGEMPPLNA